MGVAGPEDPWLQQDASIQAAETRTIGARWYRQAKATKRGEMGDWESECSGSTREAGERYPTGPCGGKRSTW
jgi:hypothetical protein